MKPPLLVAISWDHVESFLAHAAIGIRRSCFKQAVTVSKIFPFVLSTTRLKPREHHESHPIPPKLAGVQERNTGILVESPVVYVSMISFVSSLPVTRRNLNRFRSAHLRFKMQTSSPSQETRITLYSTPVSNYSARCRFLVKRKNLTESDVSIRPPSDLGGIKTEEYLAKNPFGKIPAAVVREGQREECIFESSVICEYLAEKFSNVAPSFLPNTPEVRAKARMIANILDIYIGPYHPYMYKKGYEDRESGVKKMIQGFDALEHALCTKGPYVCGEELSIGDCCLWGNWPFYDFMLPTFFGWHPIDERPKLRAWRAHMLQESQAARDVYAEVFESLQGWWDNGRWTDLSMNPLTSRPELEF